MNAKSTLYGYHAGIVLTPNYMSQISVMYVYLPSITLHNINFSCFLTESSLGIRAVLLALRGYLYFKMNEN